MAFHVDQNHRKSHNKERFHKNQKGSEYAMVVSADTVIDPGAVVIESFHTAIAHAAMTGFIGPNHFAIRAKQDRVEFLKYFHKSNVFGLFEVSRIS